MDQTLLEVGFKLAMQYGVFPVLALYLIWRQGEDKKDLVRDMKELQAFVQTTLLTQLNHTTKVVEANTDAMHRCANHQDALLRDKTMFQGRS